MLFMVLYFDARIERWMDLLGVALTADEVALHLPQFIRDLGSVRIIKANV